VNLLKLDSFVHWFRDTNPLYQYKAEVRPQFGRGFFAGIDPKEQLKRFKEVSKIHEDMRETYAN
jgi:hypothetical protein